MEAVLDRHSAARADANGAVLAATNVSRLYGSGDSAVHALIDVTLAIGRGRLTAIMGPSGSGKSTLMHILAGLDRPTSGSVSIDGLEITSLDDDALTELRRRHVGFVFQFFNLLPMLTARENVVLPLSLAGDRIDRDWVEEVVASVGIGDRAGHRPSELSGGQQQRVAIARAFVTRPTVVFADEPTGNLDSRSSRDILELLRRSVDDHGRTVLMVTHDAQAATIADQILFLRDGRIVHTLERAPRDEVLATLAEVTGE